MARVESSTDTATAILDVAERLVQERGFNGFSYADVASELGVTKASLHYHFAGKAELGESLVRRYTDRFGNALGEIDARDVPATEKLHEYCEIYRRVLAERRMCLCGMLAAEYGTLPDPMRRAVNGFFDRNEAWLSALLDVGRASGALRFESTPGQAADSIIAALEGGMLIARPYGNRGVLDSVVDRVMADFSAGDSGG